jgi:hypothetical protein
MNTIPKFAVVAAGLLSATLFAAEAPAQTAKQVDQVHQACAVTMGLNPANADYDMCVARLQRTVVRIDQAAQLERDRNACMQGGLQPDTSKFALCVLDAEQVASN